MRDDTGQFPPSVDDIAGRAPAPAPVRPVHARRAPAWVILLWTITIIVLGVMALRMIPNRFDGSAFIPIVVALVPWMTILSALILVVAAWTRRRALAVVSVVCLVVQLLWHVGYLYPRESLSPQAREAVASAQVDTTDRYARIMSLNAKEGHADAAQIVRIVRDEHVEVLALQEVDEGLVDRLNAEGIGQLLPYAIIAEPSGIDNGGVNGLWSAAPMSDKTGDLIPIESSSVPAASIDFGGVEIRFGSVHPYSPRPSNKGLWDRGLGSISRLLGDEHTFVLMGDFNATWDHASFRQLLGGRFVDSGENAGEWFHMTYPSNASLFSIIPIPAFAEIDHIVHDRGVVVGDLATVNVQGSDHRALLGTLEVQ